MRFDLSQLGFLRRALQVFGVVREGQKSIAWATMENILSAAFGKDVGDNEGMAKYSASLDGAIQKNKNCMQRFKLLAEGEGEAVLPTSEEIGLAMRAAFKTKISASSKGGERRMVSFSP